MRSPSIRKRVLFVAEDVTLAQVVRLAVLARSLDPSRYEVHFACANFDELVFRRLELTRHPLYTLDRRRLFGRLERGQRLYDYDTLARYVKDELALFSKVRPDVVIGDLRLSLCVSAPHFGVPYASLINAYWSRQIERAEFPLPDHPVVRLLGERMAGRYFPKALPRVLGYFAEPVNRLRKRYGLAPLGDLVDVLLAGDLTLFPDVPLLTPLSGAPDHHVFLGPVIWSPDVPAPSFWSAEPRREYAYVTLGSSGRVDRLPLAVRGVAKTGLPVLVATAGRCAFEAKEGAVFTAEYIPGNEAAQRSRLVVCNGGSSTGYQALAQGTPVLGIASNLDQYLAMSAVRDLGAGILLRASTVTEQAVAEAAQRLIEDPSYPQAAERARQALAAHDHRKLFPAALARVGVAQLRSE